MILVTGSSGTVGTELLKQLTAKGAKVRAAYHSRKPATPGVEAAKVDLSTGEGLDAALAGCDTVFLLTGGVPDQTAAETRAVEAARRKGVRRVVKLSVWGATEPDFSFAKIHRPVENAIEQSGLAFTLLRPNGFMQNFVTYDADTIKSQGAFFHPAGKARISQIDARDIAAVAVKALTTSGKEHEGKAYDLSGPEALTYEQCAAKLSAAAGKPIKYVSPPEDEYRKTLIGAGIPGGYADALLDLNRLYRADKASRVTTAVRDVTGRAPMTFDQFARDYAGMLK
jgi:uncharacterized protein YbjT (DUF2867 family)